MLAADGRLHGVDLASAKPNSYRPPNSSRRSHETGSLNLVDGVLYTTVGARLRQGSRAWAPAPPLERFAAVGRQPGRCRSRGGAPAAKARRHAKGCPLWRGGRRAARPRRAASHRRCAHDRDGFEHGKPVRLRGSSHSTARPNGAWSPPVCHGPTIRCAYRRPTGVWNPPQGLWDRRCCGWHRKHSRCWITSRRRIRGPQHNVWTTAPAARWAHLQNRDLVVSAGKDGTVYLLDANRSAVCG